MKFESEDYPTLNEFIAAAIEHVDQMYGGEWPEDSWFGTDKPAGRDWLGAESPLASAKMRKTWVSATCWKPTRLPGVFWRVGAHWSVNVSEESPGEKRIFLHPDVVNSVSDIQTEFSAGILIL